jgi:hypothetical protein
MINMLTLRSVFYTVNTPKQVVLLISSLPAPFFLVGSNVLNVSKLPTSAV